MNNQSGNQRQNTDPNARTTLERIVCRFEELFFATVLLAIVGLGLAPIILRFFFQTGITWTEPLTRQLVLWIALFGASAATFDRKHISIDVLGHLLPKRWKTVQNVVTSTIAAAICAVMAWLSVQFVRDEARYAVASTLFMSVPEWIFELVMPLGFTVLAARFLSISISEARRVIDDFRRSG